MWQEVETIEGDVVNQCVAYCPWKYPAEQSYKIALTEEKPPSDAVTLECLNATFSACRL